MERLVSCFFVLFLFYPVYNQDSSEDLDLGKIKSPSSPAAIIIENQVGAISSPKTWSALETNLFSNFVGEDNTLNIPNNYALEFSPYWAKEDLHISNKDFLAPRPGQSLMQNFSVSISSTQNYLLKDSLSSNAMGFGVRTMLWQGSKSEKDRLLRKYKSILSDIRLSNWLFMFFDQLGCNDCKRDELIELFMKEVDEKKNDVFSDELNNISKKRIINELSKYLYSNLIFSDDPDKYSDSVEAAIDRFLEIDTELLGIQELKADRKGFKLEISSAIALDFPTDQIDYSIVPKVGFWVTPSYQPYKQDWIEILGVFRYYNYNLDFYEKFLGDMDVFEHSVDYGLQMALKWKKYSLSFEGIGRTAKTLLSEEVDDDGITTRRTRTEKDFQYLVNFNYQISDNLILTYNFGKEFDPILNYKGNVISLLSLNFAINPPKSNIIKED